MKNKQREQSKWIIVSKLGAMVACQTTKGLKMLPMEFDSKPHFFHSEKIATEVMLAKKTIVDLEVIETREW